MAALMLSRPVESAVQRRRVLAALGELLLGARLAVGRGLRGCLAIRPRKPLRIAARTCLPSVGVRRQRLLRRRSRSLPAAKAIQLIRPAIRPCLLLAVLRLL